MSAAFTVGDLAGRRVAVWGLGSEGRAAARAALRAGAGRVVVLVDGDPSPAELDDWVGAGLGDVPVGSASEGTGDADVVLLSPGVSRYRPEVLALRARGVRVTSGTELFLASHGARTVAVTGSKGKSTVTRLSAHLLAAVGVPILAAGNIGTALLDLVPELPADPAAGPVVVAEVSSYQAASVLSPVRVAVLTSLFPDHLPWHGGVERYYADKLRLFAAQLAAADEWPGSGSAWASARIGKTPSATPASRMRWKFSEALHHRSTAQTCTPNSRRKKTDDIARPQPRSSTRMPGRRSSASVSHSVSHSGLAPPLTPAMTHSGW